MAPKCHSRLTQGLRKAATETRLMALEQGQQWNMIVYWASNPFLVKFDIVCVLKPGFFKSCHIISFMLTMKMCQNNIFGHLIFKNFGGGKEACPKSPLEACLPMILGMVDSLAGPSPGCFRWPVYLPLYLSYLSFMTWPQHGFRFSCFRQLQMHHVITRWRAWSAAAALVKDVFSAPRQRESSRTGPTLSRGPR